MTKPPLYPAKRGATFLVDIEAYSGVPTGAEVSRAVLKLAKLQELPPGDAQAVAAEFAIQHVPAAGQVKAYWRLTLSAAQTEALSAGIYITDVRIMQGGVVTYSEPILIDFRERVTPPAA
jgi:hypothetical protein